MDRIEGIIVPMITPFTADYKLDLTGLERLVNHLIAGGCGGLFPLGTTGGGPFLSLDRQMEVNRAVCRLSAGRLPVLTGISSASPEDSIRLGLAAREAGSTAVVAAPPCYLQLNDAELVDFYTMLTREIGLPVFIYNMPGMTKINLKPDLLQKLARIPGISGYKDSSHDMNALHQVLLALKRKADFPIYVGPESLMAECVMLGGAGGVSAGANLYPEIYVNCYREMRKGNLTTMMHWQEKIDVIQRIYRVHQSFNRVAMGLKTGLKLKGICGNAMLPPLLQSTPEDEQKVAEIMHLVETD
ncbi:MAG: dihydrodipicolinate synthase family protein [Victivallales bacterium]|nr:dihydrodipicolinate synthase family protein [Victivallales bacterium]